MPAPGCSSSTSASPTQPREVGFFDTPGSGPHRFGVDNQRQLAFLPNDAPGWNKRVIWTLDTRDPLKPEVVSIWGLPWQKANGGGEGDDPMPAGDAITLHGPPMIRGNRMYCAWWGGGISIIDCTDLRNMQLVGHLQWSPPFPGSNAHLLADRRQALSCRHRRGAGQEEILGQPVHVDRRRPAWRSNPIPVATFFPEREKYFDRPGRFGAHNILENITTEGPWANIVFLTYFSAGLRAVDVSDVLRPKEIGYYVPELPDGQDAIQSNDIGADDDGRLYLIDRAGAGMHILEYTG